MPFIVVAVVMTLLPRDDYVGRDDSPRPYTHARAYVYAHARQTPFRAVDATTMDPIPLVETLHNVVPVGLVNLEIKT